MIQRKSDGKFLLLKWGKYGWVAPVIGGVEEGESFESAAEREVLEETGYKAKAIRKLGGLIESHFFADHKNIWRHRFAQPVLLELESEAPSKVLEEESNQHEVIWLSIKEAAKQMTHYDNLLGLRRLLGLVDSIDESVLRNFDK
ncbi:MAG: NUDIX domain-containing protein [Candidatus Diapherotrites archaeon]|nr:NUDIX domain-containing protein [Candidatus Diapherotrites archaeon]